MRHDDRARARRNQRLDLLWPSVEATRRRVRDHRDHALQRDRHNPARVRKGADDDLGERLKFQRQQRHVDSRRPRADRIRVPAPHVLGKRRAIRLLLLALIRAKRPRGNDLVHVRADRRQLLAPNVPARRQRRLPHGAAAMQSQLVHTFTHVSILQTVFEAAAGRQVA